MVTELESRVLKEIKFYLFNKYIMAYLDKLQSFWELTSSLKVKMITSDIQNVRDP